MIRAIRDFILLKRHQTQSTHDEIKDYQLKKLQALVNYAKENSPYYHEKFSGLKLECLDDFSHFPTMDKDTLMTHFNSINTVHIDRQHALDFALRKERDKDYLGYYKDRYVLGLSSGTSGNKGLFITPKALTKRLPAVFLARSGLSLKELPYRILFLLRVFSQGFSDINAPFIKLKYLSTMTDPKTIIATLNKTKTNILMAPPSLLNQLVPHCDQITVRLKKIITYAEVLTAEDKAKFAKLFNTKIIEIYQASEGQIASPCLYGNLHINEDLVYIELYDHKQQRIDEPHRIGHSMVLTNLVNVAQPLIRYRMNDMIVLDESCPCGSSFRTIKNVLGRDDDILYFYNKNNQIDVVYPDLFARWIITESDLIREFQVTQNRIGHLDITIDTTAEYDVSLLKRRIHDELAGYGLTSKLVIAIAPIALPKDRNKYKRFVSYVKTNTSRSSYD